MRSVFWGSFSYALDGNVDSVSMLRKTGYAEMKEEKQRTFQAIILNPLNLFRWMSPLTSKISSNIWRSKRRHHNI